MAHLTKTQTRKLAREIRNAAALIARVRANEHIDWREPYAQRALTEALNDIDGISAQLVLDGEH